MNIELVVEILINEAICTGTTIEEAKNAAVEKLNAPEGVNVQIEVLEMPVKKTLGLFGGSPAKVRAYFEKTQSDEAVEYLKKILEGMQISNLNITSENTENGVVINVESDDYGVIIGRRGETLDALQYLTGLAVNHNSENYFRVTINTGNYREKRENTLKALARRNAQQVVRSGRSITLEPMNPFERRIIHTAVQEVKGADSHSVGMNMDRRVVITLAEGFKPTGERGGYDRQRNNHSGNRRGGYQRDNRDNRDGDSRPRPKPAFEHEMPKRPPHDDSETAPLYGRIDVEKK